MKKHTKLIIAKGVTVFLCLVMLYLVVIWTGKGAIKPELAIGLFTALTIVTLERGFDLFENWFSGMQ